MSSKNLDKVIQRAISDAAFRRQLQTNPAAALRGFKLTDDELAALRSGDAGKLSSLGIDQRISKAFTVGGQMGLSRVDGDLSLGSASITDTDASPMGSAMTSGGNLASDAVIDPGNVSSQGANPLSFGDPMPTAIDANATAASDAIEDQSHSFAAGRSADLDATTRSTVRDVNDVDLRGQVASSDAMTSDQIEDQSHSFAASRSADVESTVRSSVRDIAPEVQGSGLVAPTDGSPEAFAFQDAQGPTDDQLDEQRHSFAAS